MNTILLQLSIDERFVSLGWFFYLSFWGSIVGLAVCILNWYFTRYVPFTVSGHIKRIKKTKIDTVSSRRATNVAPVDVYQESLVVAKDEGGVSVFKLSPSMSIHITSALDVLTNEHTRITVYARRRKWNKSVYIHEYILGGK